jgi:hypothetical protein
MNPELAAFYKEGPRTLAEAYPPICLRTHWDPSMINRHVFPELPIQYAQQLDPRWATKVCTAYYEESAGDSALSPDTAENSRVPIPPALLMSERRPILTNLRTPYFPPGGHASLNFPYQAFQEHVNAESDVLRLDEPLTKCASERYLPSKQDIAMTMDARTVPGSPAGMYPAMSKTMQITKLAGCREADDKAAWNRSARPFFNPTKYDRTTMVPPGLRVSENRYDLAS